MRSRKRQSIPLTFSNHTVAPLAFAQCTFRVFAPGDVSYSTDVANNVPRLVLAILIIVGFARADGSDQPWQIHGQVVDEHGTPVEDFEAGTFWLSNGNWWDEAGTLLKEATAGKLWKNEGMLAANRALVGSL